MNKIKNQLRQGDVLLHPIDKIPEGAILQGALPTVVLAEGEATGHAHTIAPKRGQVKHFRKGTEVYLEVNFPVILEHQEHAPLTVQPGIYQVRRQVEQWLDEVRQVRD